MGYSQQVLDMLQQTVSGQIDNFWDFSFTFNALFGEDAEFSEAWDNENSEMFDALNDIFRGTWSKRQTRFYRFLNTLLRKSKAISQYWKEYLNDTLEI